MTPLWRETEWADGLALYAARLRRGETTAEAAVTRALQRIERLDAQYRAFVHVAADDAIAAARRSDTLLAAGTDRGPLMGVPVAVKDLFAVNGMPTRAGSRIDVAHAIGPEGPFIAGLREAGAIILGKTRTIEFAAGAHNVSHPSPWNPADPAQHRSPGGSSNGSAVAVAAGYCPVAIGSDTGGSVRSPAALCGIAGYKSTAASFSLEGAFPLCPSMDSVGIFTISAREALLTCEALSGKAPGGPIPRALSDYRFGIPHADMLSGLDGAVAAVYRQVLQALKAAGPQLVPLDWPRQDEIVSVAAIFAGLVPADLIATLGADQIAAQSDRIDPAAMHRLAQPSRVPAEYADLSRRRASLERLAISRMQGLDALIYPTAPICAPPVADLQTPAAAVAFTGTVLSLTRFANVYGLTACSVPAPRSPDSLPVGVDLAGPQGSDLATLDLAVQLEHLLLQ